MRDDNTKRLFWKLARVVEMLTRQDGIARAALINVSCGSGPPKILKRSTRHLIPIEVDAGSNERSEISTSETESTDEVELTQVPGPSVRPRRNATMLGEAIRRTWTNRM